MDPSLVKPHNMVGQVFEGMMERDVVSWSSMVDGYCKGERTGDARNSFDIMPVRNVVTWIRILSISLEMESVQLRVEIDLK